MQRAKYNLSILVTKAFDQHDHCDQRRFKGVKTLKGHGIEANVMHSYSEVMYNTWVAF